MNTHYTQYGDSLTPVGLQLKTKAAVVVDLTGKTVKVFLTDKVGTVVVAETTTGVTVTSAVDGKVAYDFPTGANALPAGTYYLYVRVYSGTERDTYPSQKREMRIVIGSLA